MEELANKIVDIIYDYRSESGISLDKDHVLTWVSQFDEDDRGFLLSEFLHILPKSYISKELVIDEFNQIFEYLSTYNKYDSIIAFLSHAKFLSCQSEVKSQTKLLAFLDTICFDQYGINLKNCGSEGIKHWIYLDDVLASGGTFKREIINEINTYGIDKINEEKISIIPIFFFLHTWGGNIIKYSIKQEFNIDIVFHRVFEIQNDPRINYYNQNPLFNHVYISSDQGNEKLDAYLNNLDASKHKEFAYRIMGMPKTEGFYSSANNRQRYEKIILDKSIEILSRASSLAPSIRPLGLTYPSYQTFGTGSHAFTWRNVSNTCPVVFWWENHGWHPLFPVENRGNH
ncbi:hypothetical protein IDJ75_00465 [Mucilaginibacter rigui]|uniref:PRTase-CE domain-containing protein n=1 Tax=Mucilaginibacter rigui TaxID=534635 RepID=A0ABR7WZF9_9SPHI|nr:hypothetical protein [Mucilaginibacter rigui]MBD1383734.1 hypothetical protein [Mucilaginibacter rigui]